MHDDSFLLYTSEGEALARRLVASVCAQIRADLLTRRQSMDRIADVMEQVSEIGDSGISDIEAVARIAGKLSAAFAEVGYLPVDGTALRDHFEAWKRSGTPVASDSGPAARIAQVAQEFSAAAQAIRNEGSLVLAFASAAPFDHANFAIDPAREADIAIYLDRGDATGNPYAGALVMGPSSSQFVEWFSHRRDAASLLATILDKPAVEWDRVAPMVVRLGIAARDLATMSNALNDPGRLALAFDHDEEVTAIRVEWEGQVVGNDPSVAKRHTRADHKGTSAQVAIGSITDDEQPASMVRF